MPYIFHVPMFRHSPETLQEMLTWTKQYCKTCIKNDIDGKQHFRFYFESEYDHLLFSLKWTK